MPQSWESYYDGEEARHLAIWLDAIRAELDNDDVTELVAKDDGNAIAVTMELSWMHYYQLDGTSEWEVITDPSSLGGMASSADGDDASISLVYRETFIVDLSDIYDPEVGIDPQPTGEQQIAAVAARIETAVEERAKGWNLEVASLENVLAEMAQEDASFTDSGY